MSQKEKKVIERVVAAAKKRGVTLMRNPAGVFTLPTGKRVSFGLAKGAADLIGWTPVVIGPEHVGKKIAVFCAVEVKTKNTAVSGAQKRFLEKVAADGGAAEVFRENQDLQQLIEKISNL
ncbi:MAG: VRR-NUC domain-containing protein [Bacteroidia bacterium]|nr:VRR-NUC domain-containing protein [Bacteroidia bacterium]